jgi:integrase
MATVPARVDSASGADVLHDASSWTIEDAAALVELTVLETWGAPFQARRVRRLLDRFAHFAHNGFQVDNPSHVTPAMTKAYVDAPGAAGEEASLPLRHLRRSSLRLLFRVLRDAGAQVGDPTIDLILAPRSQLSSRPLEDDEVALCRGHALWALGHARRAAAWGLAEATCRSVEIAQSRIRDVDLDARRVWIHGGRTTVPRWGELSEWAVTHLERRIAELPADPDLSVVYSGAGGYATGQVSACTAVIDVLTRAGLASEPDVRPASVAAWAGRRIYDETGRIDEVARRLGMASLDRTAKFIALDWRASE